jgi:hypothetical protein
MSYDARRRAPGSSLALGHAMPKQCWPPWSVEDLAGCFVVKARGGRRLAYIYYEDSPERRMIARLLSREEARSIATAFAMPPEMV